MKTQEQKAHQFRKLHVAGQPLVLFNIWDPGSAKAIEKSGAKAIATSSWAVSEAFGYSDGEHTPLNVAIDNLLRITNATDLPVSSPAEKGSPAPLSCSASIAKRCSFAISIGCLL